MTDKPTFEELPRFVERSPDALYRYDIRLRRLVFYNKIGMEFFGSAQKGNKTASSKTVLLRIHPDDREKVRKASQDSIVSRRDRGEVEYRLQQPDGAVRWLHDRWIVIRNTSGEPIAIEGIVRDETKRKQAEEALRKSEEKYRMVAHAASDLILQFRVEDEVFSYISPNCEEILGYTIAEACSKGFYRKVMVEEDFRKVKKEIVAAFKGNEDKMALNYRLMCKDGSIKHFSETSTLIRDESRKVVRVIASLKDVTDKIKMEDQLRQVQKMEAMGTLASGIAHDFNNILLAIMGNAEIALYSLDDLSQVRYSLDQILNASKRARDLVKHILTFSRQADQELKPIKLSIIVKEALKLIRASLPTTIEIKQKIDTERDTIIADPTQIHQVIMNLCTNAHHAMGEEGGTLEVGLGMVVLDSETDARMLDLIPGNYVKLTLSDTGRGMSPQVKAQIFDPYFTTKEKGVGTGLGLAVVHGIVKSIAGSITVESEPEKGTIIHVYFPLAETSGKSEHPAAEPVPHGKGRILFVDDEEFIVDLGMRMLKSLGYGVAARTSSIEALEAFKAQPDKFDLIISDMTMPNMTGKRLAEEALRIRPDIPIILCTGFSEMITEESLANLGVKGFFMKPFVMEEMARTVRGVLKK